MSSSAKVILCVLVIAWVVLSSPSSVVAEPGNSSGWGTATLIETESGSAKSPDVAVDPSGNAVAVWVQSDGSQWSIWANRYVPGAGWGVASMIEKNDWGAAQEPRVAVDRTGNATAVWTEWDLTKYKVYSNRYVVGRGWGSPVHIGVDGAENATDPVVAMDGSGNAIAVWTQYDGARYNIYANRYMAGTGWWTPTLIETDSGSAGYPAVAVDSSGNAIAVWQQHDGSRYNIWANRYIVGMGWGVAERIETEDVNDANYPDIAVDASGNFIVVWNQHDGTLWNVWSNRYVPGTGWEGATRVETSDTEHASSVRVAANSAGDAVAVFVQSGDIWANRYTAGVGWGTAELVETDEPFGAGCPRVAIDDSGNALAVWCQFDGSNSNIVSNRYVAGVGWGTAEIIETENAESVSTWELDIGVDGSGNAIAVWWQDDGIRWNIWANRYVMPDTTPPALAITSPSNGATVTTSVVTVSGTTELGATLVINGIAAAVASDGSFSCPVPLVNGSNTISATARDASGNSASATITVTYADPVSDLEEALKQAQEQLDSVADDLESTSEELQNATDELASTNDRLNRVESQTLMLAAALVVFAALAVVMSAMYLQLRRRIPGPGKGASETGPPPPPS